MGGKTLLDEDLLALLLFTVCQVCVCVEMLSAKSVPYLAQTVNSSLTNLLLGCWFFFSLKLRDPRPFPQPDPSLLPIALRTSATVLRVRLHQSHLTRAVCKNSGGVMVEQLQPTALLQIPQPAGL